MFSVVHRLHKNHHFSLNLSCDGERKEGIKKKRKEKKVKTNQQLGITRSGQFRSTQTNLDSSPEFDFFYLIDINEV